jgi:hypothetical protein
MQMNNLQSQLNHLQGRLSQATALKLKAIQRLTELQAR